MYFVVCKNDFQIKARKKGRLTRKRFRYGGYNTEMIDGFVNMGFDRDRVVSAFQFVGLDTNEGEIYELEEAYIGDITARLLGEP
jgi:hypothetical protein